MVTWHNEQGLLQIGINCLVNGLTVIHTNLIYNRLRFPNPVPRK
jgi:hypothetical protein